MSSVRDITMIITRINPNPGGADRILKADVSVLIACYNARNTIRQAIKSALLQRSHCAEVIVVDDASTDGSGEVVEAMRDERVKYVRLPQNRGQGYALNTALHEASGDFVLELDADDWLAPRSLARLVGHMKQSRSNTVGLYGDRKVWSKAGARWTPRRTWRGFRFRDRYQFALRSQSLPPGPRFIHRPTLLGAGGWPQDDPSRGRLYADFQVWLRLLGHGDLDYVPRVLYHVRRGRNSLSRANRRSWPLLRDLILARALREWDSPLRPVYRRRRLAGFSMAKDGGTAAIDASVHVIVTDGVDGALTDRSDTLSSLEMQTLPPASVRTPDSHVPYSRRVDAMADEYVLRIQSGVWLAPSAIERLVHRAGDGDGVRGRVLRLGPTRKNPLAHTSAATDTLECTLHRVGAEPTQSRVVGPLIGGVTFPQQKPAP